MRVKATHGELRDYTGFKSGCVWFLLGCQVLARPASSKFISAERFDLHLTPQSRTAKRALKAFALRSFAQVPPLW